MVLYLIKTTLIWSVLLIVYVLAFSKATSFRANRIYLLFSLAAGIVLPVLPSPWQLNITGAVEQMATSSYLEYTLKDTAAPGLPPASDQNTDWPLIAFWLYFSLRCKHSYPVFYW